MSEALGPIRLPEIRLNRKLFQLIIGFLVFIYLATRFSWAKGIYDKVFPEPELRIQQFAPTSDIHLGNEKWFQRVVLLRNYGRQSASDVFISVVVPFGRITRYQILSQEAYTIGENTDIDEGVLNVSLTRLAYDAQISVYLWGMWVGNNAEIVRVSASSDSGAARPITEATPLQESEEYAVTIARLFREAYHAFRDQPEVSNASWQISRQLFGVEQRVAAVEGLRVIGEAALLTVVLSWLLLPRFGFALVTGMVSTLFIWLFLDLLLPASLLDSTALTIVLSIILLLTMLLLLYIVRKASGTSRLFWLTALAFVAFAFIVSSFVGGKLAFNVQFLTSIFFGLTVFAMLGYPRWAFVIGRS